MIGRDKALRRAVAVVAALNLAYFGIEFAVALLIGSISLFADAGSLTKAAFLSARNDALANVAIVIAGLVTLRFPSVWPDVIVGLGIAFMNLDAAREVWMTARDEHCLAQVQP